MNLNVSLSLLLKAEAVGTDAGDLRLPSRSQLRLTSLSRLRLISLSRSQPGGCRK